MRYYDEEIVKKLLTGEGPRELKFCPSIEAPYPPDEESSVDQPSFERMKVIRSLNEVAEKIRELLTHCREDRQSFPAGSAERIALEGRIDGLLFSLDIIRNVKNNQAEEWYNGE